MRSGKNPHIHHSSTDKQLWHIHPVACSVQNTSKNIMLKIEARHETLEQDSTYMAVLNRQSSRDGNQSSGFQGLGFGEGE